MNVRSNQSGFSLIELMIVVAIIGILATVAIPNFQRFQAKAKQSEARGSLAAYYTSQKAFFSEWQIFPGQFSAAGFRPEGQLNYRVTGVNNAAGIAALVNFPAAQSVAACVSTSVAPTTCYPSGATATTWQETNMATASANTGCAAAVGGTPSTNGTFVACAAALHSGAAASDVLQIDQDKRIQVMSNGI